MPQLRGVQCDRHVRVWVEMILFSEIRRTEMRADSNEFRRYAEACLRLADEACLRLADKVQAVEDKAELLSMAQAWVQLADRMGEDDDPTGVP